MQTHNRVEARKTPSDDVTASELGAFAYCAKAWHLERVIGVRPTDHATRTRDAGVVAHDRHGRAVRLGVWLGRRGRVAMVCLTVLAVVLGLLAWWIE